MPPAAVVPRHTSPALNSTEEGRAFLQIRAGRFGLVLGTLGMSFLAVRLITGAVDGHLGEILDEATAAQTGGNVAFLLLWLTTRKGRLSLRMIWAVEALFMFTAIGCYLAMGSYLPIEVQPHYIVLLALTMVVFARAVWVPSTARRTFLVGTVIGIALVAWVYLLFRQATPAAIAGLGDTFDGTRPEKFAVYVAATSGAWWLLTVSITAAASWTIFGLHRETRLARRLGQYTLIEKLGEGGMGAVYRAKHVLMRRPTAIKLLVPDKAGETAVARFEREVQLTSQLSHPNTVSIYDYGRTPDGLFYYVMELLEGATLERVVEIDGPQHPARAVHILMQMAGALAEAHGRGLVHRDIKPNNVMLVEIGGLHDVVKVVDFGLVKELDREVSARITQVDAVTGTPQYLPPEAITAPDDVDARSDLYALGAVAYYLVTGEHVFTGKTVVEVCTHHLHTEPIPPSDRLGGPIPRRLETLILDLLSKAPDDRPQTATDVQRRLEACVAQTGRWTQNDARRWWSEIGTSVRHHDPSGTHELPDSERAIELELGRRTGFHLF